LRYRRRNLASRDRSRQRVCRPTPHRSRFIRTPVA
jgi:hypothetical protein